MKSSEVRNTFLDFFRSKGHHVVPSAPMVIKDDPTLMFTNAGMNQFKDIFLGSAPAKYKRIADTQKCLRVSGKHNDLEEVGHDTYHHTMFEMLGNWSFGDYFKKEAIAWGWEYLTKVLGIPEKDLYATVFEGSKDDGLPEDSEALHDWKTWLPSERIIYGSKKDNFWEMGDTGPCGPCSEIHIDLRPENEKLKIPGQELVNKDHPLVIEIWNLVFIEFNRLKSGRLEPLPSKHVDTGMGFERLCMVLQGKTSNYDTDIFQPLIRQLSVMSGISYGKGTETDVAMRVIADHLRAVCFAIADGQLPSNTGAGYVIRRILRRAVRYGFTFLNLKDPFLHELVHLLSEQMGQVFPELKAQEDIIRKVITEEEIAFMRTLSQGIKKFDHYLQTHQGNTMIDGAFAFELFDTYGFPIDLTQLMAKEKNRTVDMDGFKKGLEEQKSRSRNAAITESSEWTVIQSGHQETEFLGYATTTAKAHMTKYRKVISKKKAHFEIILDRSPFYAESGGQVGDTGYLDNGEEKIRIINTIKEHNQIVHIADKLFKNPKKELHAVVDTTQRLSTTNNHSATHLLHAALRQVLGSHVEQKGSLVDPNRLRFDFAHFSKMTEDEIHQVEKIVNRKIRENIPIAEERNISFNKAKEMGAMALFGEKYGEKVRVIAFDKNFSIELCGGTHVEATGQIGYFKIISESAIAAGIRRIEALTSEHAEEYIHSRMQTMEALREMLKNPKDVLKGTQKLIEENQQLQKQLHAFKQKKADLLLVNLKSKVEPINNINFIAQKLDLDMGSTRDLAFKMARQVEKLFLLIGTTDNHKVNLTLMISEDIVKSRGLNAAAIIREIAQEIKGGGGGQDYFATAGGKNIKGLNNAFEKAKQIIEAL